ncbi:MAG: ribonuclease III [Phycisphaerales bacterium]|nr:ribonuclease III [Phycisphaerales bacterium]
MDDATLATIEAAIGHTFRDRSLLAIAMTHASVSDSRLESNERLEFLGDAILGMVICRYLFDTFPDLLEGDLTKIKSSVVSRRTCSKAANRLGLQQHLRIGKGMMSQPRLPSSLSAAVLEAIIAAIHLDAGHEAAQAFILRTMSDFIEQAADSGHQQNFKSVLQQHAQRRMGDAPQYVILDEKGPDHSKCFEICVEIGTQRFASSWGNSKKQAEQQAALNALIALGVAEHRENGDVAVVKGRSLNSHDVDDPA